MWAAASVVVPVALVLDQPWRLRPSAMAVATLVWLGLSATAFATIIYFRVVSTAGPTFLSLMNYVIPVVALAAGVVLLNEPAPGEVFIGLALILSGLAVTQLSRGRASA